MATVQCGYCRQDFETIKWNGAESFPLHREAPDSVYGCQGALTPVSANETQYKPFIAPVSPGSSGTTKVDDSIQDKFEKFHEENPKIYQLLVKFAREAKNAGFTRFAVRPIVERARWFVSIETRGDVFKINNDFCSRYSRVIMEKEKDLAGFFETRILRAEKELTVLDEDDEEDNVDWWKK